VSELDESLLRYSAIKSLRARTSIFLGTDAREANRMSRGSVPKRKPLAEPALTSATRSRTVRFASIRWFATFAFKSLVSVCRGANKQVLRSLRSH